LAVSTFYLYLILFEIFLQSLPLAIDDLIPFSMLVDLPPDTTPDDLLLVCARSRPECTASSEFMRALLNQFFDGFGVVEAKICADGKYGFVGFMTFEVRDLDCISWRSRLTQVLSIVYTYLLQHLD